MTEDESHLRWLHGLQLSAYGPAEELGKAFFCTGAECVIDSMALPS